MVLGADEKKMTKGTCEFTRFSRGFRQQTTAKIISCLRLGVYSVGRLVLLSVGSPSNKRWLYDGRERVSSIAINESDFAIIVDRKRGCFCRVSQFGWASWTRYWGVWHILKIKELQGFEVGKIANCSQIFIQKM